MLGIVLIVASLFGVVAGLKHWNVSINLEKFNLPVYVEFTEDELNLVKHDELVKFTMSMHEHYERENERERESIYNLRKSILLLSCSTMLLSALLGWFMFSIIKQGRKGISNESDSNT